MLTATDLIGKMLQAKAREFEVPLVTYAEDMSLNNGMHLLMYGDHILANEVSMLGNIDSSFVSSSPWAMQLSVFSVSL